MTKPDTSTGQAGSGPATTPPNPGALFLVTAKDEDLQVAEDWLREQGRHEEANRIMAFRRFEPLLRQWSEAADVQSKAYVENGHSYKSRKRKRAKELDAICAEVYRLQIAVTELTWEVFGKYVCSWQRGRAMALGKIAGPDDEPTELEVDNVVGF